MKIQEILGYYRMLLKNLIFSHSFVVLYLNEREIRKKLQKAILGPKIHEIRHKGKTLGLVNSILCVE